MVSQKGKSHQIRLSGDTEFQRRLRQARLTLRRLGYGEGHLNDVGTLSLYVASARDIIKQHRSGRYSIASSQAKAPAPRTLVIAGDAVNRLTALRSEMIAQGEDEINLRAIVHYAICLLADKDDKSIAKGITQYLT